MKKSFYQKLLASISASIAITGISAEKAVSRSPGSDIEVGSKHAQYRSHLHKIIAELDTDSIRNQISPKRSGKGPHQRWPNSFHDSWSDTDRWVDTFADVRRSDIGQEDKQ